MPHIRLVENKDSYNGALYLNGTKVLNDECISAAQLIEILNNNLGIDAKTYAVDEVELDNQLGLDTKWPDRLREYGDLIDPQDRI